MTTDERLDKLEKELARAKRRNRRLLAVVGLVVGAFALVWIVARAGCNAQSVIRANAFVLQDENGKARAELRMDKDGPGLSLFDAAGKTRAGLTVVKDAPMLSLYDENGKAIWQAP